MLSKVWRVIFDYDDTLIRHNGEKEFPLLASYLGVEANAIVIDQMRDFFKVGYSSITRGIVTKEKFCKVIEKHMPFLAEYGLDAKDFLKAQDMYYTNDYAFLLFEDVIDTLEYLKAKGYMICMLTNGFYTSQLKCMQIQNIAKYFDALYAWDNFYPKPNERAFFRAMAGTYPYENVMVGNSLPHDIAPAKALGIPTIGIHVSGESSAVPDITIGSLSELKRYL